MFGSKINHSDLQKLEEENKNLTHKICRRKNKM